MNPKQKKLKNNPLSESENFNKLKSQWYELASKYNPETEVVQFFWDEIIKAYSSPKRHYHNLFHLDYMSEAIAPFKHLLNDPDAVYFSI